MRRLGAAAWIAVLAVSVAARAQDPSESALAAERAADPRAARAAWESVLEERPGSRAASRARTRIAWIDARSEGGHAPLAALWRFQHTPPDARTRAVVLAFGEAISAMPPGLVRREARAALAEDLLRIGEPARARAAFEALLAEPGASEAERVAARDGIARAMARGGDDAGALAYLEESGLRGASTHGALAHAELTRRTVPVAIGTLALYLLVGLALGGRAVSRKGLALVRASYRPWRVIAAAWVALGPVALASWYDDEATDTFLQLGAGTLVVAAIGALAGSALVGRPRLALAGLAVCAQLAVAWLVLLGSGGLISFVGGS